MREETDGLIQAGRLSAQATRAQRHFSSGSSSHGKHLLRRQAPTDGEPCQVRRVRCRFRFRSLTTV